MKVLVTRPEPGASATAAMLAGMGWEPVLAPCLEIAMLRPNLPDRPAAIVLTSAQAIPALPAQYRDIPGFCVGDATAARLRAAGFAQAISAAGTAEDLARLVTAHGIAGPHLLAVGQGHGMGLAQKLRGEGVNVIRRVVYAARGVKTLGEPARAALAAGEIARALFYSGETARAFARLRPPGTAGVTALALSAAVAAQVQALPWRAIRVALAPNEKDLLALLEEPDR